jgi:hypothetical protein
MGGPKGHWQLLGVGRTCAGSEASGLTKTRCEVSQARLLQPGVCHPSKYRPTVSRGGQTFTASQPAPGAQQGGATEPTRFGAQAAC